METNKLKTLLKQVAKGEINVEKALTYLKIFPYEDLGFARVDHHRILRKGFPEVIFGKGKTPKQIIKIATSLKNQGAAVLITKVNPTKAQVICKQFKELTYHNTSHCLTLPASKSFNTNQGLVVVIAAGTSDLPVAEEALLTAKLMGSKVKTIYDVGVSGLHRLIAFKDLLKNGRCFITVAGMEGALPSVVAGLVEKPVVAVPTSIGYGTSFGGIAALLGMLNTCAPGLSVVNIDNGFGAGYLAGIINQMGL